MLVSSVIARSNCVASKTMRQPIIEYVGCSRPSGSLLGYAFD